MSTIINADTSNGLKLTSDTSGEIELQANGVTKAKVTANGLQDANNNVLATQNSLGVRNLIINGDMRIDQRNGGSSVTISSTQAYFTDRFSINCTGSVTGQQVIDAPSNMVYSLKGTVNASTLRTTVFQRIEANNLSHALTSTTTLSFWAKSSQTGIRSVNYTLTDSSTVAKVTYIAEFNITSANTWQQFSINIPTPSTLTGVNTYGNSVSAQLSFMFSKNSSPSVGTVDSWNSASPNLYSVSTNLIDMTSGGTFNITGVQLEVSSVSTDFEFRPYDMELQRCQRYYWKYVEGLSKYINIGCLFTASAVQTVVTFPTTMRTTPTFDHSTGTNYYGYYGTAGWDDFNSFTPEYLNLSSSGLYNATQVSGTAGHGVAVATRNASAYIAFDAEL